MPRRLEFDATAALDAAVGAFWAGGVERTSIDDLLQSAGIARSSLYNSFGNKQQLFRRALDRYVDQQLEQLDLLFDDNPFPIALERLLLSAAHDNNSGKGCLLVNSIYELRDRSDPSHSAVKGAFRKLFRRLAARVVRAQEQGELPEGSDAEHVAVCIMTSISGLRTMQLSGLPGRRIASTARYLARSLASAG